METEAWTAETRLGKMTIDLANTCEEGERRNKDNMLQADFAWVF